MPELFEGTKWIAEEVEDYWIPDITTKSKVKLPKCPNCSTVHGLAALKYKYCPECGINVEQNSNFVSTDTEEIINKVFEILTELHAREVSGNCVIRSLQDKVWKELCNDAIELLKEIR